MRNARILLALMVALAAAGCMRKSAQTYYIMDPQTGQPIPVVSQQQQTAQAQAYPQQTYSQQSYPAQSYPAPQAYAARSAAPARSLYSTSPAYAQQAYAQQQYAQPAQVQQPRAASGRGLFSSGRRTQQTYVQQQPALQQPYVAQYTPPPQAAAPAVPRGAYMAMAQARPNYGYAAVTSGAPAYTLDSGDKLRVVVFGQDGITNSYTVDAGGNVNLPLIGGVPARGTTTQQLSGAIAARLKQGFVRDPSVSVEVEAYRPFFILGEVTTPGQYPYVANMTVETAVAIAGGFGPRASKKTVELTRNAPGQQMRGSVPLNYPLVPGDTIVIKERWF